VTNVSSGGRSPRNDDLLELSKPIFARRGADPDEEVVAAGRLLLLLLVCSLMEISLGGGVGGTSLSEVRRRADDLGIAICAVEGASEAFGSTLLDEDRIGREYEG
jgi:hypothetical protein